MRPDQSRVVLTGAAGGIGRAAAQALVRAGSSVLLVGRSAARLTALERSLSANPGFVPGRVAWHVADVTQEADIASLRDAAGAWGANVLVNNAGLPSFGRFETFEPSHFERVIRTNLLAPMMLARALLPDLRCQPRAQIIQVGSVLGRLGLPGHAVYCASKFGLRGFSEALRRELADTPVRVQYLGPRSTRTDFNDAQVRAYNHATGAHSDSPEQVAEALLSLLSGEQAEMFLGWPEKWAVRANGLAPAALDPAFRSHLHHLPDAAPELARTWP